MNQQNQTFPGVSGVRYVLNFGTNAACRIETALDRPYDAIMAELRSASPRVTTIREWVKAALVEPDPATLSLDQVGDLLDDLGGWTFILCGLDSASPSAKKAGEELTEVLQLLETAKAKTPAARRRRRKS